MLPVSHYAFLAVIWSGAAIATLALSFRLYVRIRLFPRRLLTDDYLVLLAYVLLLASAVLWQIAIPDVYTATAVVEGRLSPPPDFASRAERQLKSQAAFLVMFYIALWSVKFNFLVFFWKLVERVPFWKFLWWVTAVLTIAAGAVSIAILPYGCLVRSLRYVELHCRKTVHGKLLHVLDVSLDIVTDVLVLMLPFLVVWRVRVEWRKKLALAALFSLVLLNIGVAIVRLATFDSAQMAERQSWTIMWNYIEITVAVLVASLGAFRTLYVQKERRSILEDLERTEARGRAFRLGRWCRPARNDQCRNLSMSKDDTSSVQILEPRPTPQRTPTHTCEELNLNFITSKLDMERIRRGEVKGVNEDG